MSVRFSLWQVCLAGVCVLSPIGSAVAMDSVNKTTNSGVRRIPGLIVKKDHIAAAPPHLDQRFPVEGQHLQCNLTRQGEDGLYVGHARVSNTLLTDRESTGQISVDVKAIPLNEQYFLKAGVYRSGNEIEVAATIRPKSWERARERGRPGKRGQPGKTIRDGAEEMHEWVEIPTLQLITGLFPDVTSISFVPLPKLPNIDYEDGLKIAEWTPEGFPATIDQTDLLSELRASVVVK